MKHKKTYTVTTLAITLLVCTIILSNLKKKEEYIIEYNFIGKEGYIPDKKVDLRDGTVYLCFSAYFRNDLVRVQYDNIDSSFLAETDEVTGHAYDLNLGKFRSSNLRIIINESQPIDLLVDSVNQILLIEKSDSLLKIYGRLYLQPFY